MNTLDISTPVTDREPTERELRHFLTGGTGEPDLFEALEQAERRDCERCGQDRCSHTVGGLYVRRGELLGGPAPRRASSRPLWRRSVPELWSVVGI